MRQVYITLIFMLTFSLASFAIAETIKEQAIVLPEAFTPVDNKIALSSTSIFYNQQMEKVILENIDNRFIIVHFWASWCMECSWELIDLNSLQHEFRKKPLLVMAVSEDFKGINAIDAYFTKYKINYLDIYLDKKGKVYNSLSLNHLPATYLIDFSGKVIAKSTPGKPVNWQDPAIINYLDDKMSHHSLLPPEYKKIREKYQDPKPLDTKTVKQHTLSPKQS